MPKPGFFKSVLGKPSRSYADSYVAPYDEPSSPSNYGFPRGAYGYQQAGPSRSPRSSLSYSGGYQPLDHIEIPRSSFSELGIAPSSPKTRRARRSPSDSALGEQARTSRTRPPPRHVQILTPSAEDEIYFDEDAVVGSRTNPPARSSHGSRKPRRREVHDVSEESGGDSAVATVVPTRTPASRPRPTRNTHTQDVRKTHRIVEKPAPLENRPASSDTLVSGSSTSPASSVLLSPTMQTHSPAKRTTKLARETHDSYNDEVVTPKPPPPQAASPSPPLSGGTTPKASPPIAIAAPTASRVGQPARLVPLPYAPTPPPAHVLAAALAAAPAAVPKVTVNDSDSESDTFYTPRSSFYYDPDEEDSEDDAETPGAQVTDLPVLQLQPPTPSLTIDNMSSPFNEDVSEFLSPNSAHGMPTRIPEVEPEYEEPTPESDTESKYEDPEYTPVVQQEPLHERHIDTESESEPDAPGGVTATPEHSSPPRPPPKSPLRKPSKRQSRDGRVRNAQMTVLNGPSPQGELVLERPSSRMTQRSSATERPSSRATERPPSRATERPPSRATERPLSRAAERPPSRAAEQPPSRVAERPPSRSSRPLTRSISTSNAPSLSRTSSVASAPLLKACRSTRPAKAKVLPKTPSEIGHSVMVHGRQNSYQESEVSQAYSTASAPPQPDGRPIEGVRAAGFGKGGWAAASAAPVVMYMPSGSHDGWAAFQPLPPRSRFSPLPRSSSNFSQEGSSGSAYSASVSATGSSLRGSQSMGMPPMPGRFPSPRNSFSSQASGGRHAEGPSPRGSVSSPHQLSPLHSPRSATPVHSPLSTPPDAIQPPVAEDSDSESEEDELPSRSYAKASPPILPNHANQQPQMPVYDGRQSFDYASEHPTSAHTSAHSSPHKYDGSGQQQRWVAPAYDPYADERARSELAPRLFDDRLVARSETMSPERMRHMSLPPGSGPPSLSSASSYSRRSSLRDVFRPSSPPPPVPPIPKSPRLPIVPMEIPLDPVLAPSLRPTSPAMSGASGMSGMSSPYDDAARAHARRISFAPHPRLDRPSSLNPDQITFLPEMSIQDSNKLYMSPPPSESGRKRLSSDIGPRTGSMSRSGSVLGRRGPTSDSGRSDDAQTIRRPGSSASQRPILLNDHLGPNMDRPLMESHGREQTHFNGYTGLVLPKGGSYKPSKAPLTTTKMIDPRLLGTPHAAMAAITLSSSLHTHHLKNKEAPTPMHLRHNLPPPVDFSSHIRPPSKIGHAQILVQVYAVAVDYLDVAALDHKTPHDVGKWIPGRSFVGRCLAVGGDEKDIVRGDVVMGLLDIKKSGALCEYMAIERRRAARAPILSSLTLEELAALPAQGIAAHRALRGVLTRGTRALVMDANLGVQALMCQEMSRAGVAVTAVIGGGEGHAEAQAACMTNGARGVLTGSPAAVLLSLDEGIFDLVVDTRGGVAVDEAARRALTDGGRIISLAPPSPSSKEIKRPRTPERRRSMGFLRGLGKRHGFKNITVDYVQPAGAGEPEVDTSGQDCRDVLDEPALAALRPCVAKVVPFERGASVFTPGLGREGVDRLGTSVVRIVN